MENRIEELYNTDRKGELEVALRAGYIDSSIPAKSNYMPKLLVNDSNKQTKVLTTILSELRSCDEFYFSVAFITNSGVECIIDALKALENRGIKGKILASSYQNFTQPRALKRLIDLGNLDVRIQTENNFHAKGYIFRHGEGNTVIIGSSNLTQNALCANSEWNLKVSSFDKGSIVSDIKREFDSQFASATVVDEAWLEQYRRIYRQQLFAQIKANKEVEHEAEEAGDYLRPSPNKMQKEALESLQVMRAEGRNKALLISATGTGKTFFSAFDASAFDAKKLLFIVHRERIAKAAMSTFKRVFGQTRSLGLYTGRSHELDRDFIFTTVQTMSREAHYTKFDPEQFDYIVIDEVHRSAADSYQRLIDYFKPAFLLGMSATPERTDGVDIFKTFDYNIAYEIRLQAALEENMLTPFHYHGVTDITVDDIIIDENSDFRNLVCDERVRHILDVTRLYGCDKGRIKGLIFCSKVKEAEELADKLNALGVKSRALSGDDSDEDREKAIQLLESDDPDNYLEYILTVDIFNEGIDIPCINQVVMLRPTESAIIFVQQLGRGLRLFNGKEYVVVIDFIGNYKKSFLIPIALSGDRTYNKDNTRRVISEGSRIIPGCSTIDFDEISRERIYASIDQANYSDLKIIKESYKNLKARLGHVPSLMEFDNYSEIDPLRIFDNQTLGSYHTFLSKYEKEGYDTHFTPAQENVLKFISKKLAPGKRPHELIILKLLMDSDNSVIRRFSDEMERIYNVVPSQKCVTNIINVMTNEFPAGDNKRTFQNAVFIRREGDDYSITSEYKEMLLDPAFKAQVQELIEFGLHRNERDFSIRYKDSFLTLNAKYTYDDVTRMLEWEKGEVAQNIGGYRFDKGTRSYPVFINYDKAEDEETINYQDRFLSPDNLIALSKKKRYVSSEDIQTALHADELGVNMELFVRKNKDDKTSKEFYYLGRIHATGWTTPVVVDNTNAVEIEYQLETPVKESLYEYLIS